MQANPQSSSDMTVLPGTVKLTITRRDFPEWDSKRPINRGFMYGLTTAYTLGTETQ